MGDGTRAEQMDRRHLVKLSGVAGATGLLGLVGAGSALADGRPPAGSPLPPPAGPGGSSCPTPSNLCGFPGDTGGSYDLWDRVQVCLGRRSTPPTDCLRTTATYVVLHGSPENSHNFLLLPTCRVKGIECPFVATSGAPNYWLEAWNNAQPGQPGHVVYPHIGLGVNSAASRQQDQLHIHLAGMHSGVQTQLNTHDSSISNNPANWRNQIVPIWGLTSTGMSAPRSYRVLHTADLNSNLFTLLRDYVVGPTGADMGAQMLAVTPRLTGGGGFYVLNSEPGLQTPPGQPGGTGTVDFLLAYA